MGIKTRPLTMEELGRFTALLNGELPDRLIPYAACAALCLGTGGRIGEILGMRNRDLFGPDGEPLPRVSRNVEKRGKPVRTTTPFDWGLLGRPVVAWHRKRFWEGREALFVGRGRWCCWNHLKEIFALAGIRPKQIAFHGLRKTTLTMIHEQLIKDMGGDSPAVWRRVQRFACHARMDTTLIYLDNDPSGISDNVFLTAFDAVPRITQQNHI